MKIVAVSNYDDVMIEEEVVAENVNCKHKKIIMDGIHEASSPYDLYSYELKEDDYKLYGKKEIYDVYGIKYEEDNMNKEVKIKKGEFILIIKGDSYTIVDTDSNKSMSLDEKSLDFFGFNIEDILFTLKSRKRMDKVEDLLEKLPESTKLLYTEYKKSALMMVKNDGSHNTVNSKLLKLGFYTGIIDYDDIKGYTEWSDEYKINEV